MRAFEAKRSAGVKLTKPRHLRLLIRSLQNKNLFFENPKKWQWLQIGAFSFVTKLAGFEYTDYVNYDFDGDLKVLKAEKRWPERLQGHQVFDDSFQERFPSRAVVLSGGELFDCFVGRVLVRSRLFLKMINFSRT